MSVSLDDLQPKPFIIKIKEHEIECKPLRLSHTLILSKIGETFQNPKESSSQEMKQAEKDLDFMIGELMPLLSGVELGMSEILEVIQQMMDTVEPSDNKELKKRNIQFGENDPKGKKTG